MKTTDATAGSPGAAGSAMDLLREILETDRAAIREMQSTAPWYQPPDELRDLHRRMEACLSDTSTASAITYVGSGPKGPHVIYLAEGKRITVGRDKATKGPAWLVIEETPVVKAQSPNTPAQPRREEGEQ